MNAAAYAAFPICIATAMTFVTAAATAEGWQPLPDTAPHFHNGLVHTIDEAVRVMASTQLNKTLTNTQVADIVAFLESLSGPYPNQTMPRLPPTPGDLID